MPFGFSLCNWKEVMRCLQSEGAFLVPITQPQQQYTMAMPLGKLVVQIVYIGAMIMV